MREIKARGKRKDDGEWYYGDFCNIPEPNILFYNKDNEIDCEPVDSKTVGQYTGLKDKNGKEIYEGDIYQQGDSNIKYLVVWHDTGFIGKQVKSSSYAGLECWKDKIEIIGNIYESKE